MCLNMCINAPYVKKTYYSKGKRCPSLSIEPLQEARESRTTEHGSHPLFTATMWFMVVKVAQGYKTLQNIISI